MLGDIERRKFELSKFTSNLSTPKEIEDKLLEVISIKELIYTRSWKT